MTRSNTLALILALAVVGAGCGEPTPVEEVVVGVRATGCSLVEKIGTGVAVDHDDRIVIVTSAHTVAGSKAVTIDLDGSSLDATIVAFDPRADLAVLDVDGISVGRSLDPPAFADEGTVVAWDPETGIAESPTAVTRLLRVSIEDIYFDEVVERRAFEFAADIEHGDSGGPIFDLDGDVLGVVYARSRERAVGFAVSTTEIQPLVESASDRAVDAGTCVP